MVVKVVFHSIEDIHSFVNTISGFDTDIDISRGSITLDGKSFSGLCNLELHKPLSCNIHDSNEAPKVVQSIQRFMC